MTQPSLRFRLILIILTPLLLISSIAGYWQFINTATRAENIFDRGLLSAALAISKDIAISDGDALSPSTRQLVNDTSGGELFYHVFAPDGVFVTGYSTPPVLPKSAPESLDEPFYYNARYLGKDVRVLRFQDATTVSGFSGLYNITVWQSADVRTSFVQHVVSRSFAVILFIVLSVALVVWFGVSLGLRPLLDLEKAIAKRTPTELEPIRRAVPIEARSLVNTLNRLLDRISRRISSKDEFISNAAHQLRNPVAGVLALAEAVKNAPNPEAAKKRSIELVQAARETSILTNQLLSFERANGKDLALSGEDVKLPTLVREVVDSFQLQSVANNVVVDLVIMQEDITILADSIMLQEAILNLLTNAAIHGGPELSTIEICLTSDQEFAKLSVKDDGVGIPSNKHIEAISRFGQANAGPGSGLGLPIAARVMENHGGALEIVASNDGGLIVLTLPIKSHFA
jgi:two-component system sensor histidine kinase TctE